MKSHEYANRLNALAEFLLSKPEFEFDSEPMLFQHYYDKEPFLDAVRALGAGSKEYSETELIFRPSEHNELRIYINRDKVCRKVQQEKWECEPLLSPDEEAQVGA